MIYLDANVLIFAGLVRNPQGDRARKMLVDIHRGLPACTSSLTFDEFMWIAIREKKRELIRPVIESAYGLHNFEVKTVSSFIPIRALFIMEETGLKPRDAFHVAIMEEFGIKEIVSDDADFDKVPWIKRIKI